MNSKTTTTNKLDFLQGGGEMGELVRNYDWESTSLGNPENWPLSLRTTVGIVLHSAFPMFLFWGKDLLCFYNDAYRPSLGIDGKHPAIGKKAKAIWPEIWDFIGPIIHDVMTTGISTWYEDQLLPIFRNGKMEDVYWTFSYSPAYGDDGNVAGVFVTCTETTKKVAAMRDLQKTEARFRSLIEEAPLATCLFTGKEMRVEIANEIVLGHWGKGRSVIGKTLEEVLPEIKDQDFPKILDEVFTTGKTYEAKGAKAELIVNGVPGTYYFDFTYKAMRDETGEIYGVMSMSLDVTAQVIALRKLEKNQKELLQYFEQSPVAIATMSKENLTFRLVNPIYAALVGRTPDQIKNKTLFEALPELAGQGFDTLLENVINTGVAYIANEVPAELMRNGVLETIYVNLTYQPQRNYEGEVTGILVVATEVTQQVLSRKKIEDSEAHLQLLRDTVPAMIFYMDSEQRYRSYNGVFMDWYGVNETEALGKTTREFTGEAAYEKVLPYLTKAYAGEQMRYEMFAPSRKGEAKWLSIVYTPHTDTKGNVVGVIVHATDITQSKHTELSLRVSESRFRSLIEEAPFATCLFTGRELKIELANEIMLNVWGRDRSVIGKQLHEALPELMDQPFLDILDKVFTSGLPHSEAAAPVKLNINGKIGTYYFNYIYKPLFNEKGEVYSIMNMAVDVTAQVLSRKEIEESELFSQNVFYNSPVAKLVFTGHEMVVARINENMLNMLGRDSSIIGKTFSEAFPELQSTTLFEKLQDVFITGKTFNQPEEKIELIRFGKPHTGYYDYIYKPLVSTAQEIYGVMVTATEVTEQVTTRQKIEAKEKELRNLISASPIGICVLTGPEARIEEVNDMFVIISGKKREQFIGATYWEVFAEVAETFAPVLENVFKTGIKFTSVETEMILIRSGKPEKMYATFDYVPVIDNGIVTKVIVIVIEVTHQVETRKQIEEAVIERTGELAEANVNLLRSNQELEQFAYIASHDLQEPVRKISTFAHMLENSLGEIDDKSKGYLQKINASTLRMTNLIRDVLAYSQLREQQDEFEQVDLNTVMHELKVDFELMIEQKMAVIESDQLPVIQGISLQITQLFGNLLSNSLKYSRPGIKTIIQIKAKKMSAEEVAEYPALESNRTYFNIEFRDNGIGFKKEYADRIFKIFQRLHGKSDFEGTGIGLSVCKKIVQNHHGEIVATNSTEEGAVFNILLPLE